MPETPEENLPNDPGQVSAAQLQILRDTVSSLIDEKAAILAANARLATQLKDVIAEKEDLRRQLAAKSGMGIHENRPGTFNDLKRGETS